jgi:hypothetical protein
MIISIGFGVGQDLRNRGILETIEISKVLASNQDIRMEDAQ